MRRAEDGEMSGKEGGRVRQEEKYEGGRYLAVTV